MLLIQFFQTSLVYSHLVLSLGRLLPFFATPVQFNNFILISFWLSSQFDHLVFFKVSIAFFTSKLFLLLLQCCHWSMIFLTVTRLLIIRIIILYRTFTLLYWSFGLFCFQDNAFLMKTATWQCLRYVFIFRKCYFLKKKITFESWGRREQIRSGLSFLPIIKSRRR